MAALPTRDDLHRLLDDLDAEHTLLGSALVTRDGLPVASTLATGVNRDTFAAMAATMVGAAETAAAEMRTVAAHWVVAECDGMRIAAARAGKHHLVVLVREAGRAVDETTAAATAAGERARRVLEGRER